MSINEVNYIASLYGLKPEIPEVPSQSEPILQFREEVYQHGGKNN